MGTFGLSCAATAISAGLSPGEIADGERRLRRALPDAYKKLLSRANGLRFRDCVFFRPGLLLDLQMLSAIRPPSAGVAPEDLIAWNQWINKSLGVKPPRGSVVFGHSPKGGFLFYASGPRAGQVAFEDRVSRQVELLAPSMEEFLAALRSRTAPEVVAAFPVAPIVYASSHKRTRSTTPVEAPRNPRVYQRKTIENPWIEKDQVVRDVRAVGCTFSGFRYRGDGYAQFERIELVRPGYTSRHLGMAAVRDLTVEGAKTKGTLSLVNVLCHRVKLIGDFGNLFFRNDDERHTQEAKSFAASFYDDVDWALDIRGARFKSLTLRSIPGHLVLRDPARHALILSERLAKEPSWRGFDAETALEFALEHPDECHFLAVNDFSPKAAAERAEIRKLRAAGFVD